MLEGISLRRVAVLAVLAPLLAAAGKTASKPAAKKTSSAPGPGLKYSIGFLRE